MAEKTDQEIIEELGLEQDNNQATDTDTLQPVNSDENLSADNPAEENNSDTETNEEYDSNTIENEDLDEEPIQKKKPKILKILIGVIAALSVVLTLGTIMYLAGFFDDEENKEPQAKAQAVKVEKKPDVDIDDIDKNKLNKKLQMLTKTEILNKEELEAEEKRIQEEEKRKEEAKQKAIEEEKRKEEERIAKEKEALEKEKQLLEERQMTIKKEQEEFLKLQEQIKQEFEAQKAKIFEELQKQKESIPSKPAEETTKTNVEKIIEKTINNEQTSTNQETEVTQNQMVDTKEEMIPPAPKEEQNDIMNANLFLSFINVAVIKGDLHKSYLDKVESFDKKISLCRDSKNRIEIYFGPYESPIERNKVFNSLMDNGFKDAFLVDFTKEEYQKRCNY
ncbi:hypothetical protein CRV03_08770 [Arcobacter sp. F155]|uniref:hypothetical protein n=1 Tax=Arcobacter sp. F155 TaxID=2044512 RepID=UPI0010250CC2|nr:hypothetical protein [Arcobacter sp. F155]RXJ76535.1 hypothetical protein CRV03_08770 [Arcobacter sp. F155]